MSSNVFWLRKYEVTIAYKYPINEILHFEAEKGSFTFYHKFTSWNLVVLNSTKMNCDPDEFISQKRYHTVKA